MSQLGSPAAAASVAAPILKLWLLYWLACSGVRPVAWSRSRRIRVKPELVKKLPECRVKRRREGLYLVVWRNVSIARTGQVVVWVAATGRVQVAL